MKIFSKYLLASVLTFSFLTPAMAVEEQHRVCDSDATVELGKMGMVNEAALQEHIDKVKAQMKKVRHGRGSHFSQKQELRKHLSEMKSAMQELHNQMYAGGCKESLHGASLETRIEVMEKYMGMQQQMIEQLLEHLSEQEQ